MGGLSVGMGTGGHDLKVVGMAEEAASEKGHQGGLLWWVDVAPNIKGTESSVPVACVQRLEHHHPNMVTLWGHENWSKINRKERYQLAWVLLNQGRPWVTLSKTGHMHQHAPRKL